MQDRFLVTGVRFTRVGQAIDLVHGRFRDRHLRRIANHRLIAMPLYQSPRIMRIGLVMDDASGFGKGVLVAAHLFKGWQRQRILGNLLAAPNA